MTDVKYELIVENGASGGQPIEAELLANNIIIDGHVVIAASSGSGTWGAIDGDIDDQADLKAKLDDMQDDIDTKYVKPSGGIPSSDMTSAVQTSLGKADTAYQKPSGGIPSSDMTSGVQTSLGKADTAYQKPVAGIPSTDMTSSVQTSLGLADTALQKSDVVNSVLSQATDEPLSANMGYEMQQEINNLKARGRFLSLWNCITGLPKTNPVDMPYSYKAGDYYIVSQSITTLKETTPEYQTTEDYDVGDFTLYNDAIYQCNTAIIGGEEWTPAHWTALVADYIPSGSSYTGAASSTTTADEVKANDFYEYDGVNWLLLNNTAKTLTFANIAGDPQDNLALASEFSDVVRHDTGTPGVAPPINADQLDGHAASYFATEDEVDAVRGGVSEYDPTATYDTGDWCLKLNLLRKCKEDNVTGVFDDTKWDTVDLTTLDAGVVQNASDIATNTAAISSLSTYLNGMIVTESVSSSSFSVNANSYTSVNVDTTKSGYTAVGVVGMWLGSNSIYVAEYTMVSTDVKCVVRNTSSSAVSGTTIKPIVLYVKNIS